MRFPALWFRLCFSVFLAEILWFLRLIFNRLTAVPTEEALAAIPSLEDAISATKADVVGWVTALCTLTMAGQCDVWWWSCPYENLFFF